MALTPLSSLEKIRTDETVDDQPAQFGDYGDLKNVWHLNIKTLWKMLNWSVGLSDGQLLIGKTIGNVTRAVKAQLTGANGVKITNGPGTITVGLDTFGGAARLLVSDSSGVPQPVAMSGDVSIDATGHTTVNSTTAPVNAQPATTSVQGVVEMSVAPVSSATPIAVGDNDPRMSDQRTPTDGSVTTAKLAANAVTTAKIADAAVGTNQIADGSITSAKLAAGVGGGSGSGGTTSPATTAALGIVEMSVAPVAPATPIAVGDNDPRMTDTRTPTDGSVTAAKLAAGAVVAGKIAASAVGTTELADGSVTSAKLAAWVGSGSGGGAGAISTYPTVVLNDSPLAYLRLNEAAGATSAVDETGNGHNGTYGSAVQTGVPGAIYGSNSNGAAYFDGTSGATITLTPWSSLPTGAAARSMEAWFCQTGAGNRRIGGWGTFSSGQEWSLDIYGGNLILDFNGTSLTGPAISLGVSYHVVATYDGTTAKLYLNGVLAASLAITLTTGNSVFSIGATNGFFGGWIGLLDEFTTYGAALTQAQVIAHYTAGRSLVSPTPGASSQYDTEVLTDSPLAYYKLSEAAGATTALDASGNGRAGSYDTTSGAFVWRVPGAIPTLGPTNKAAYFTGTNSVVSVTGPTTPATWLPSGNAARSIECWINPTRIGNQVILSYGVNTSGQSFSLYLAGATIAMGFLGTDLFGPALSIMEWYHIVATHDGTTTKLYVNGILVGSMAITLNTAQIFNIDYPQFFPSFQGTIDKVAIYDHALTQDRIIARYVAATAGGAASPSPATPSTYRAAVLADSPLAYWKLDEAAGQTVAHDETGNSHDGAYNTTAGALQLGQPGALAAAATNRAVYFNGSANAQILVPVWSGLPSGNAARTLECWAHPTVDNSGMVVGWGSDATAQIFSFALVSRTAYLDFGYGSYLTAPFYFASQWYHLVGTHDGTTAKFYINGALVVKADGTLNTVNTWFRIGGPNANPNFNGWIDEVAVYDHALTQDQIINHYLAGRP